MAFEKRTRELAAQARDRPPDEQSRAESVDIPRQYGLFPNVVALSPAVEDIALVMAAYRATFAGPFILTVSDVGRIARRGSGERPYWRGLRILQAEGLLERRTAPSGRQGPAHVVDDVLTLPQEIGRRYRRVERLWFGGTLSVKALALLLFVRASGDERASAWHVVRRFGWTPPTVKSVADELIAAGHIERRGQSRTPVYAQAQSKIRQSKKEQPKKRQVLHSVEPLHTVSPLHTVYLEQRGSEEKGGLGTDEDSGDAAPPVNALIAYTTGLMTISSEGDSRRRQGMVIDLPGAQDRLCEDARRAIEAAGQDPDELLDRARAQLAKGRLIGNINRYCVRSARNALQEQTGCSEAVATAIMSGTRHARAAAYAALVNNEQALRPPKAQDGSTPNGPSLMAALEVPKK